MKRRIAKKKAKEKAKEIYLRAMLRIDNTARRNVAIWTELEKWAATCAKTPEVEQALAVPQGTTSKHRSLPETYEEKRKRLAREKQHEKD